MEVVGSVKFFSSSPANTVSGLCYSPSSYSSSFSLKKKKKKKKLLVVSKSKSQPQTPSGASDPPPRITSNLKQNLQFLKLWKEFQKRKSCIPKPATSYRRKKVEKEDLPGDTDLYRDPTLALYYTNQGIENAAPVLLVDGYNVCGYWVKLKKHFMTGKLDMARQKLIDELIEFSMLRELMWFIQVSRVQIRGLKLRLQP